MFKIRNLSSGYGKKEIIKDISFDIYPHNIIAIIGQSGSGKSTLLKSLNRIIEDEGGFVGGNFFIGEKDFKKFDKLELREKIGIVFQEPVMFPLSIYENLSFVMNYHYDYKKNELDEKIKEYLSLVNLYDEIKDKLNKSADDLSGGQKQRLSIARSLCVEPELLLLDEPCSSLDSVNIMKIEKLLLSLKKDYSILMVTHNLSQAKRIADYIVLIDKGRLVEVSSKKDFFENPKSDIAKIQVELM